MMRRQQGGQQQARPPQQQASGPPPANPYPLPGDEWEAAKQQAKARQRVAPQQNSAGPRAMQVEEAPSQDFRAPPGACGESPPYRPSLPTPIELLLPRLPLNPLRSATTFATMLAELTASTCTATLPLSLLPGPPRGLQCAVGILPNQHSHPIQIGQLYQKPGHLLHLPSARSTV